MTSYTLDTLGGERYIRGSAAALDHRRPLLYVLDGISGGIYKCDIWWPGSCLQHMQVAPPPQ
eukprot:386263-Rhodomonas_salina.1